MSIIGFILHSLIGVKIKRRIKFILLAEGSSRCWDRWSSTRNKSRSRFYLVLETRVFFWSLLFNKSRIKSSKCSISGMCFDSAMSIIGFILHSLIAVKIKRPIKFILKSARLTFVACHEHNTFHLAFFDCCED